jgi:hypothetical protein
VGPTGCAMLIVNHTTASTMSTPENRSNRLGARDTPGTPT